MDIYIYSLYRFYSPRIENLNLLVRIKSLNLFLYSSLRKAKKFTGPNQVLLILGLRTGTHREGCFYWINVSTISCWTFTNWQ